MAPHSPLRANGWAVIVPGSGTGTGNSLASWSEQSQEANQKARPATVQLSTTGRIDPWRHDTV